MSIDEQELLEEARAAMSAAYAPYSGYRVGAVLEAADGRRFTGCNVENASYPATVCAERVALGTAVAAGAREFRRLAIYASGDRPATPCGVCRQALAEFSPDLEVVSGAPDGASRSWNLRDLLPEAFRGRSAAADAAGEQGARSAAPPGR